MKFRWDRFALYIAAITGLSVIFIKGPLMLQTFFHVVQ